MKRSFLIGASLAVFALSACGHKNNSDTDANASLPAPGMSLNGTDGPESAGANNAAATLPAGQAFANAAAASDAFEIATSKLALDKASKASEKKFARQMITAHTASTEKLKTVASGLSPAIMPDPTLSADQQKIVTDLQAKSGANFDSAYKMAQIDGHQKTLDAIKSYAASGDVPALKTFASGLVPTVAAHLNMAKSL
jgi:putative membrane protein